jgi:tRNA threonylcarbamoyladenosine biosynthesis protein TsaB
VKTLLIENSSSSGTLAVADSEGQVVDRNVFQKAGELAAQVESLFERYERFDEIVIGIGPGSYTGIRVSISFAIGLKLASGCNVYGCPSIFGFNAKTYSVIGDARRGSYFLVAIENEKVLIEPQLIPLEKLEAHLKALAPFHLYAVTSVPDFVKAEFCLPIADHFLHWRSHFQPLSEPIYLKPPHITGDRRQETGDRM